MDDLKTSVPTVKISLLKKIVERAELDEQTELSFEFIIANLFPTCWNNIQADLKRYYTLGYLQAREELGDLENL